MTRERECSLMTGKLIEKCYLVSVSHTFNAWIKDQIFQSSLKKQKLLHVNSYNHCTYVMFHILCMHTAFCISVCVCETSSCICLNAYLLPHHWCGPSGSSSTGLWPVALFDDNRVLKTLCTIECQRAAAILPWICLGPRWRLSQALKKKLIWSFISTPHNLFPF